MHVYAIANKSNIYKKYDSRWMMIDFRSHVSENKFALSWPNLSSLKILKDMHHGFISSSWF